MKTKLVRFDKYIIYRVHIKDHNKVIRVKDLQILKDTLTKAFLASPDFDGKPKYDTTQIPDKQGPSDKSSASKNQKTKSKPF